MKWLLKKIIKTALIIFLFNTIFLGGFISWISFSVIHPALSDNGLNFSDIVSKKHLSKNQVAKVQSDINKNSSSLGKHTADNLLKFLNSFFGKKDIDFSNKPTVNISSSNDDIVQQNEKKAQDGLKQGLELLSKSH